MPRQPSTGNPFDSAELGRRLARAMAEARKTQKQVALEAGTTEGTVSKIVNGVQTPTLEILIKLAGAAETTVGFLVTGDTADQLTPEDYAQLRLQRGWIDEKLPKIDARGEPNAVMVRDAASRRGRLAKVAEAEVPWYFSDENADIVVSAEGESLIDAGIMAGDYLFVARAEEPSAIGKIVVCRVAGALYAKRLLFEHGQRVLASANQRYNVIRVGRDRFELVGVVVARAGQITE